jgi:VIT1/CCC1 family predicted Fe2+/Mn2+ transporter
MSNNTETGLLQDQLLPPVRSSFLTVLCILTFVGSGFGLLSSVPALTGAAKATEFSKSQTNTKTREAQRQELIKKNDKGSKFALKMMDSAEQYIDKNKLIAKASIDILSFLVCLAGAFLMWRLKTLGYYVYTGGIVIWIVSSIAVYGTGSFIAVIESGVKFFIGLLFVILYAFNLKDLKQAQLR